MKNIYYYYLAILLPLALIFFILNRSLLPAWGAISLVLGYSIFYRTYIDGLRLAGKKIIAKNQIWKIGLPGSRYPYFKELYFKK